MSHYLPTHDSFGSSKKSFVQHPSLWGIAATEKQLLPTGHCSQRVSDHRTNPCARLCQATASADHHPETPPLTEGQGWLPRTPRVSFFHAEKSLATATECQTELDLQGSWSQHCTKDSQRMAEVSSYPNTSTNYLTQQKKRWLSLIFPEHFKEPSPKYHLSFETLSSPKQNLTPCLPHPAWLHFSHLHSLPLLFFLPSMCFCLESF